MRARGFTLVEVLLYTIFVSIMMTSMVLLANTAFTVRSKLRATAILGENSRFVVGRITALTAEASAITTPSLGTATGTLVLTTTSSSTNPTTISTSDGRLYVAHGTSTAEALTSNEVFISSFSVTRVSSTAPFVRIVISSAIRNGTSTSGILTVTTTAAVRR